MLRTIQTEASVGSEGVLRLNIPGIKPGLHRVVLVMEDEPILAPSEGALSFADHRLRPLDPSELTPPG